MCISRRSSQFPTVIFWLRLLLIVSLLPSFSLGASEFFARRFRVFRWAGVADLAHSTTGQSAAHEGQRKSNSNFESNISPKSNGCDACGRHIMSRFITQLPKLSTVSTTQSVQLTSDWTCYIVVNIFFVAVFLIQLLLRVLYIYVRTSAAVSCTD